MVTGVFVTEADCLDEVGLIDFMIRKAQIGRLWVKVENRGFCVRYWLSTAYVLETFYRYQLTENLAFTPDIQLILNPALNPTTDKVWVCSLRARLTF